MNEADLGALAHLMRGQRTAALGSLLHGAPYVSLVLYAEGRPLNALYLHLSRLAVHTQNLLVDARASLMIAEPDASLADPQTVRRVSLLGEAAPLTRDSSEYAAAHECYVEKFTEAAPTFDLADFDLYRLIPREGRFIAAFGRILNITADHLRLAGSL